MIETKHIKFLLKQLNVIMIIGKSGRIFFGYVWLNPKLWIKPFYLLKTSADCGETEDVIQAYHRLIDLKTKYVDKEVEFFLFLNILINKKKFFQGITTISTFVNGK